MKILEYHPRLSYYVGGGERITAEQIKRLCSRFEVSLITSATNRPTEIFEELMNYPIKIILLKNELKKIPRTGDEWDEESKAFASLAKHSLKGYDLIITHYTVDSLAIPKGIKNVLHLHGVAPKYKKIDGLSLKRADAFVSVADYVTKAWKKLHKNFLKNVPTIYNGINLKRFKDLKLKREIDFLYLGRLEKHKGVDTFLHALSIINNSNIRTVIAGTGSQLFRLKSLSKKLGLNISFLGEISDSQIVPLYNRTKVFVHPAFEQEGTVITLNEAVACGCVPVSANCCGMREVIDEKTGYLFDPKNPEDLAKTLINALNEDNTEILKQARQHLSNNFDIKKNARVLGDYYEGIIK